MNIHDELMVFDIQRSTNHETASTHG